MSVYNIKVSKEEVERKLAQFRLSDEQLRNTTRAVVPYAPNLAQIPVTTPVIQHPQPQPPPQQSHSTCIGLFSFLTIMGILAAGLSILYYGFSLDNNFDANLEFKELKIRTEIEILTGNDRFKSNEFRKCLKSNIDSSAESKAKDFYDFPLGPLDVWTKEVERIRGELERGDLTSFPKIAKKLEGKQNFIVEGTPIPLHGQLALPAPHRENAQAPLLPVKVGFDLTEHISLDSLLAERDKAKAEETAVKDKYHCYYLSIVRAEMCYGEYAEKVKDNIIAKWTKWESEKNTPRFIKLYAFIHSLKYEFWGKIAALSIIPSIAVIGIVILILRGRSGSNSCGPSCCNKRNKTE